MHIQYIIYLPYFTHFSIEYLIQKCLHILENQNKRFYIYPIYKGNIYNDMMKGGLSRHTRIF